MDRAAVGRIGRRVEGWGIGWKDMASVGNVWRQVEG